MHLCLKHVYRIDLLYYIALEQSVENLIQCLARSPLYWGVGRHQVPGHRVPSVVCARHKPQSTFVFNLILKVMPHYFFN